MTPTATVREAYLEASSFLRRHRIRDAEACAELLLRYALGLSRSELFLRWEEPFPTALSEEWERLLARKAQGEPVQYITGEQYFYGLSFAVTPAVLIPRPETELLVEQAIRLGRELFPGDPSPVKGADARRPAPVAADIGTGSGAIAVTLAVQCPCWSVLATDVSPSALEVAQANAARNGVAGRIDFLRGSLLEPLIERRMAVDMLVSNPPYIRTGDLAGLQPEVGRYEPRLALDGGPDGLRFYREIVGQMAELPDYPRFVGFEVGLGQAEAVRDLLHACGIWDDIRVIPDLAGIDRHVIGLRKK